MISFLQPLALLALAAAALPTLLHLLGRRLPPVVVFPAVRYLTATEREHSSRLRLRNLLLLVLRTLALALLVLAAARPVAQLSGGGSHPPTAVALIVDNSLSSRAVVDGALTLSVLRAAGRSVLLRLAPEDRLWIVLADGVPRRLTRLEAQAVLDSLRPTPLRLDLTAAVRAAAAAIAADPLPLTEVVLLSDLQASALSPQEPLDMRVLALEPPRAPLNRWIDSAWSQPRVWSPAGAVVAALGGAGDGHATTVRLAVGANDVSRAVAGAGEQVVLSGNVAARGWATAVVQLERDEFRADDQRFVALNVVPPAKTMATEGAGRFVADALAVLEQGGRVSPGDAVVLSDELGPTTTIVFPPSDPVLVGALNRSLADRGISWRFGQLLEGEWAITGAVGAAGVAAVFRRHRLLGDSRAIALAGGDAWLVREGNVVLVGSRMEVGWTDLPVSAPFVPFIDFLVNQVAARESWVLSATPAEVVELPAGTTALSRAGESFAASTGRMAAPLVPGVYFLTAAGGDTIGALELNYDVRESRLAAADVGLLRARLASDVQIMAARDLARELFSAARRVNLVGLCLVLALACVVLEFAVASSRGAGRALR
ncbi:MAG: VWA domain-containing protein [Gemmatimonadota bacterium]|nr:MAG: VWA domain-containing protein [Gemmatimonadota bacterium]